MARREKPPALDETEYRRLAAFRRALRGFLNFSEAAAKSTGLSAQQYQALLVLRAAASEAVTVNDLAGDLFIRHNSAVGLVDRLVMQELVVRKPSESDGRKVGLSLTPKGNRLLESLAGVHRDELKRIGPELRALIREVEK